MSRRVGMGRGPGKKKPVKEPKQEKESKPEKETKDGDK